MIPAPFEYDRPATIEEALGLLAKYGDDAKVLAGGHSLLPAMKLRLAQPRRVIDIGRLPDLRFIRREGDGFSIGALTTHYEIESSVLLKKGSPLMPEVATTIGDVQVRNRGTIGGSLAHADPSADWPAAILALEARLEIAGPEGRRLVEAKHFFVDLFQTALKPSEILVCVHVPSTPATVAYEKFAQKASGFAICGVAVVKDRRVRMAVTGVAAKPYRAEAVEAAIVAGDQDPTSHVTDGIDTLGDIHASAPFRTHLVRVHARRALERALKDA